MTREEMATWLDEKAAQFHKEAEYFDSQGIKPDWDLPHNLFAAAAALRAGERRWVPVGERMPDVEQRVLIKESDSDYIGIADFDTEKWWCDDGNEARPTHWMPLPEPPKEAEK